MHDPEDSNTTWEVATHGRRLSNYLIDVICLNFLSTLLRAALQLTGLVPPAPAELTPRYLLVWGLLWSMTLHLAYYTFFEALFYRTPGKMVTGTRVMTLDGDDPDLRTVILRSLTRLVPFEMFSFLGNLNEGWHDRWTNTCVVRRADEPAD
ncbi:MAG TPA: RDD family protein [bacterium]|nr:RDD family protein [bacterium]